MDLSSKDIRLIQLGERKKYEAKLGNICSIRNFPSCILIKYMRETLGTDIHIRNMPNSSRIEIRTTLETVPLLNLLNKSIYRFIQVFLLCDQCNAIHDTNICMRGNIIYRHCRICDLILSPIQISQELIKPKDHLAAFIEHYILKSNTINIDSIAKKLRISADNLKAIIFANKANMIPSLIAYVQKYHICDKCYKFNTVEFIVKGTQVIRKCKRGRCRHFSILNSEDQMNKLLLNKKYIPPALRL